MSQELVSILVLIAMLAAATALPVNMGVLAFVATFIVGSAYTDLPAEDIALLFRGRRHPHRSGSGKPRRSGNSGPPSSRSSSTVDVSPLSTNGAIVLANSVDVDRQVFFRRLLAYGAVVVAVAPVLLWLVLVIPAS